MQNANRNQFLLALGSNALAEPPASALLIGEALAKLKGEGVEIIAASRMWRTPAWPPGNGPDFANSCVVVESAHTAQALLAVLHSVEAGMGRVRLHRWGQRVIDLDLLAAGQAILPDCGTVSQWMALVPSDQSRLTPPHLLVPHPRMHQRGFVLVPLAEVAPNWVHPVLGQSVAQMLAALDPAEIAEIRPI